MLKIAIDKERAAELRSIANEPIERLQAGLVALKSSENLARKRDIATVLKKEVEKAAAEALSDMLVSFSGFVDSTDSELDEVFESLVESADGSELSGEDISKLQQRISVIKEMCEVPRVTLIGKSLDIRDSAGSRVLRAKVYTTSRPIFDSKREEVEGSIVLNALRIDYINEMSESETFEVVLTIKQLERLNRELEMGIKKAQKYSGFLKEAGLNWVLSYDG